MFRPLRLAILGALFSLTLNAQESFFLMPKEQKEALSALLQSIHQSQKSLDIAIYSFTNRELSKAIRKAAERGIAVRLIYDESANKNADVSTIGYLAKYRNIEVCTLSGNRSKNNKYDGLMHMKMAIIDQKILVLGSANWSKSAFENNYETLLLSENRAWVEKAGRYFEEMKRACRHY